MGANFFDFGKKIVHIRLDDTILTSGICTFYSGGGTSSVVVATLRKGDSYAPMDAGPSQAVFWAQCD